MPRSAVYEEYHTYGDLIYLRPRPRTLVSATSGGTALTIDNWRATSSGRLVHNAPTGELVIHYTHGYDAPDAELREQAFTAIRSKLLSDKTGRPSRQVLLSNELGTVRLAQPGQRAATGEPGRRARNIRVC